ncbi:MAG: hypothetical protein IID48_01490 [Proteobacteria bacterium]|nr:hypothetical protein [Pseudomonadota bacterium]
MRSIKNLADQALPLPVLGLLTRSFGSFRAKEKLGLNRPPWYAYGLLSAADRAAKLGYERIVAIEFGVASGRGLRNMVALSRHVAEATGVEIRVVGFDLATGMPPITDYRDHPEAYGEGDFPMIDEEKLRRDIGDSAELIIGDMKETVISFKETLNKASPVGFVVVDVDIYSSTKAALRLFDGDPECYLPLTYAYFDESSGRSHFNKYCGELLAIEEFNQEHEIRKIALDRGIWNGHRRLGPQLWYERMYVLHVFDHPGRFPKKPRQTRFAPEY